MKIVTTHEAKTHLSRLVAEAEAGEEIVILRGTVPAARLIAVGGSSPREARPKVGSITSKPVHAAPDAWAPLADDDLDLWGIRGS